MDAARLARAVGPPLLVAVQPAPQR
jgi:hypothetical protein